MPGLGWISIIVIGALAGYIAEKIMKFDTGLLMNMVLGIAGAIVMNFIFGVWFGAGYIGNLINGVIGACVLIYVYKFIKSKNQA